jgi:hypothetical protein
VRSIEAKCIILGCVQDQRKLRAEEHGDITCIVIYCVICEEHADITCIVIYFVICEEHADITCIVLLSAKSTLI